MFSTFCQNVAVSLRSVSFSFYEEANAKSSLEEIICNEINNKTHKYLILQERDCNFCLLIGTFSVLLYTLRVDLRNIVTILYNVTYYTMM